MDQPYRPANKIVPWTVGLLIMLIVLDMIYAMIQGIILAEYPDYYNTSAPLAPGEEIVSAFDIVVGGLYMLALIPTVVMFCVWLFRASKNARALGARGMKCSAGWAVGSFFVPIINLFKPYLAVKEVEKASDPQAGPMDWTRAKASGKVGVWWAFWIASGVLGQVTSQMAMSTDPVVVHDSCVPDLIGSLLSAIAGVLAIRVIQHIHALQERKVREQPASMQATCLACGYDIRGTPGLACPECGTAIPGREAYDEALQAPDAREPRPEWARD